MHSTYIYTYRNCKFMKIGPCYLMFYSHTPCHARRVSNEIERILVRKECFYRKNLREYIGWNVSYPSDLVATNSHMQW